jgi:uncharacterized protein with GYD domain
MTMYLVKFSYTPETWARMLASPEDRRTSIAPIIEGVGGKLHGLWYSFGDTDGYVLAELPNAVSAAGTVTRVAASGAFTSVSTTVLLTVEEMLEALHAGASTVGYRAPGAASG